MIGLFEGLSLLTLSIAVIFLTVDVIACAASMVGLFNADGRGMSILFCVSIALMLLSALFQWIEDHR
jgi:uncharacterized membrane protein YtjA (UPF0391 family)